MARATEGAAGAGANVGMRAGEQRGGGQNRQPVRLAWLQPVRSLTANGPHAVVIAPALVSVEVFRAQQTYKMLIARHEPRGGEDGRRPRLSPQVLFRGTQGYLSLELWGKNREAVGRITPEFFNRSGEHKEIPLRFMEACKAAVKGATTIDCREAMLARAGRPQ